MGDTVYVLATVQVDDWDTFKQEYFPPTVERIEAHGGSVLVGTDEVDTLEGEWDCNWTVVIEFPSEGDAHAFFEDEEYAEVAGVRHEAAESSDIVLAPSFDGV